MSKLTQECLFMIPSNDYLVSPRTGAYLSIITILLYEGDFVI